MTDRPPDEGVRMRGFQRRTPVADVFAWLQDQLHALAPESIHVLDSAGRVVARSITSATDVPRFSRAMMDGFALHAADTSGASSLNRLPLSVIGESLPAKPCAETVARGQAVRIMTGAPMPHGADAVLPVEYVETRPDGILVMDEIAPSKHVGTRGEDIARGTVVLPAGRRLRPQDVGLLASIGVTTVTVVRQPRVRIVVTGNELLPPGSQPEGYRIVDSNSPMLQALVVRDGGIPSNPGIIADDRQAIRAALHDDADVILVSGGSSVGQEDYAPQILAADGTLDIHGIAMRPSSPTGMGRLGDRLVLLLPGNPVSCLCAYDFYAGSAIRVMGGRRWEWPYRRVRRRLARKVSSVVGRVDYARVCFTPTDSIEPLAISGAALLSSTTKSDGFIVIPENSEGFAEGTEVDVYLYDE